MPRRGSGALSSQHESNFFEGKIECSWYFPSSTIGFEAAASFHGVLRPPTNGNNQHKPVPKPTCGRRLTDNRKGSGTSALTAPLPLKTFHQFRTARRSTGQSVDSSWVHYFIDAGRDNSSLCGRVLRWSVIWSAVLSALCMHFRLNARSCAKFPETAALYSLAMLMSFLDIFLLLRAEFRL